MCIKNNRQLLHDLYVKQNLSLSQIASMYSVSAMTVRAWLNKNNIKVRPSTQTIYHEIRNTPFSDSQKSLVIGSILGDGALSLGRGCKNARLSIRHCENQKDYLVWKRDKLKPFTRSKISMVEGGKHTISGMGCTTQNSYTFTTISHPYLTDLYNKFYDGGKIIPMDISTMVDGLVVAIWICDDGCFVYDRRRSIYRLDLHTECFTYTETVRLCRDVLSKLFRKAFRINKRQYKSGTKYYICLSGKENLKSLVAVIKPFIPYVMRHKFKHYIT